ncbi:amidohydrolase family protein [Planctomycetota bacterium]
MPILLNRSFLLTTLTLLALILTGCQRTPEAHPLLTLADQYPNAIVDTHIHFFEVTREGGVPWPPKGKTLYRDTLPADYKEVAEPLGIISSGIVEASNLHRDNLWVADLIEGDDYFPFFVARLPIGAPEFLSQLDELMAREKFVGIRGWLGDQETINDQQFEHLQILSDRGLTLDLLSRGNLHPKLKIHKLAQRLPQLRIIINHLAGAKGERVDPQWEKEMALLASNPNVYMKFSSFCDMFNTGSDDTNPWDSRKDLAAYVDHFWVLMKTFGPDRLIWGSNWPVPEMSGGIAQQVSLAEEFLEPLGKEVRDKVMYRNALTFYQRQAL